MSTLQLYRVLFCNREMTNTTHWENGRPVKYPEVIIRFEHLTGPAGQLYCVEAETPESALLDAQTRFFLGSPLRHSLAVEPLQ